MPEGHDKYELIVVSRNRYRILSLGLGILLALSLVSLITIMPLKQYIYRLIEVNTQTGEISTLKEVEGNQYAASWVVTRYFINQYVINRHLYSHDDLKRTFNLTLSMTSKNIADDYINSILDTNPESPLNTLNTDYSREVNVLGINQLSDATALVRLKTITRHKSNKLDVKTEELQVVIKWAYLPKSSSQKDLDKNPLGFFVTYYQVSDVATENN